MPLAVASSDMQKNVCTSSIVMMEPTQDREGEDLAAFAIWWHWPSLWLGNLLLYPLMRPGSVEGVHIRAPHPLELLLIEGEQMIEGLTSSTSQETLTHCMRARSVRRRVD